MFVALGSQKSQQIIHRSASRSRSTFCLPLTFQVSPIIIYFLALHVYTVTCKSNKHMWGLACIVTQWLEGLPFSLKQHLQQNCAELYYSERKTILVTLWAVMKLYYTGMLALDRRKSSRTGLHLMTLQHNCPGLKRSY